MSIQLTPDQIAALERLRASFTADELAEIKKRQRESAKLIAKLAAAESLGEQQQLADELCPRFDNWIRGRNRILSTPARARTRAVTAGNPHPANRDRKHRPGAARRTSSSSRTSSADPGDPDPDQFEQLFEEVRAGGYQLTLFGRGTA